MATLLQEDTITLKPDDELNVPQDSGNVGYKLPSHTEVAPDTVAVPGSPNALVFASPATNLIVNPKAQVNHTDGWSDLGTVTRSRDTAIEMVGAGCFKFITSAANSGMQSGTMACTGSTDYVLSCYVRGGTGGEQIVIGLEGNDSGINDSYYLASAFSDYDATTGWQRIWWPITTSANDTTLKARIYAVPTASTIYVDAVQLEAKQERSDTGANAPTPYIDGDLGGGHAWSGTANNSSSTRTGGLHILAQMIASQFSGISIRPDGSIAGKLTFRSDDGNISVPSTDKSEPISLFEFVGSMITNIGGASTGAFGSEAAIVRVQNLNNGCAGYVKSAVSTREGFVFDFGSLTTGSGLLVYGPSDLTDMISGGGYFFKFAAKSGASAFAWSATGQECGNSSWVDPMGIELYGGGTATSTYTTAFGYTVNYTSGSPTVTGNTGAAFLTDFRRGDLIRVLTSAGLVNFAVLEVISDTNLKLTQNMTQNNTNKPVYRGVRQYKPANITLEEAAASHASGNAGVFHSIYLSGGSGQPRIVAGASPGADSVPTDDHQGDGIAVCRNVDTTTRSISSSSTETTVITGYTIKQRTIAAKCIARLTFFGDIDATSASTLTWRVKLGATTILTTNAQQIETSVVVDFRGVIEIVGTGEQAQKVSIMLQGKGTSGTDDKAYMTNEIAAATVDMRIDQALTVTAQFSDTSSMNVETAYLESL